MADARDVALEVRRRLAGCTCYAYSAAPEDDCKSCTWAGGAVECYAAQRVATAVKVERERIMKTLAKNFILLGTVKMEGWDQSTEGDADV